MPEYCRETLARLFGGRRRSLPSWGHSGLITDDGAVLSVQTIASLNAPGVGDVDVVVAPDRISVAINEICRAGGSLRPGTGSWSRASNHGVTVDWRGTPVDIRRRLTHAPVFSLPPHEEIWERPVLVEVGGAFVRTLPPPAAAVHIAVSSAHEARSQLIRVADLALAAPYRGHPARPVTRGIARDWGALRQWGLGLAMLRRLR
jgi:hypothetical protein